MLRLWAFLLVLLLLPLSLSAAQNPGDEMVEVTVQQGEHLINICEKYLEDPGDWVEVARINRLKDPNLIHPGQTILIPVRLLMGIPVEGTVTFIKGDVRVQQQSSAWQPLSVNDRLEQGARIKTGQNSALEVTFSDGVSILLRANTTVQLTAARKKSAFYFLYRLYLESGKTVSRIKKVTGKQRRFIIHTPSAVAGVRGTDYRIGVDAATATRCEVLQGEVEVEAARRTIKVKEGQGTLVKKGRPPVAPVTLLPPPTVLDLQPLYRSLPFSVQFAPVNQAVAQRILINRDQEGRDTALQMVIGPQEPLRVSRLDDGHYYLQAQSIDRIGLEGHPFEPRSFQVRVNPLPPFTQSPASGERLREKKLTFEWLAVQDAEYYQLQVAEDRQFERIVVDRSDLGGTRLSLALPDWKTYFFRLRSIAGDGYEGLWSDTLDFELVPPPPAPEMGAPQLEEKQLRIRWGDLGPGYRYHFQLAADKNFEKILVDEITPTPEIVLDPPERPRTYYVRTSALEASGREGPFGPSQTFKIKRDPTKVVISWGAGVLLLLILL